jgi:hypothetical protein
VKSYDYNTWLSLKSSMKKIMILGIVGIIIVSFAGCSTSSREGNATSNYESTSVNTKTESKTEENDNKKINGAADININSNETIDEKIALDDVKNINIDISTAKVSVKSYDGAEIKITGKLSEKSKGMNINKSDSKIQIVEKSYALKGSFAKDEDDITKIDILIPSKFTGDFIFKQGEGTSDVEGIKVKNIDIAGGAVKLKCDDIKFEKLNLNSGVGKFDFNLKEKCGDIEINGGVGETNIKMAEVGGSLKYKGGVGSTNITIPTNSPVKFVVGKGLGNCKIDAKTSGEETYTFDLKVGVGAINVSN